MQTKTAHHVTSRKAMSWWQLGEYRNELVLLGEWLGDHHVSGGTFVFM
jgi:hypothetical protein